jgi:hypothetical protein
MAREIVGCPLSNDWKNESKNFLVCDLLFNFKEAQCLAMIVELFYDFNSLVNTLQEINSELQVIANDQIHLMHPAEEYDEPRHANKEKLSHFPSITSIICAHAITMTPYLVSMNWILSSTRPSRNSPLFVQLRHCVFT